MKIKLECDYALVDEMCVDEEYEKFVKQINLRRKARGLSPMQENPIVINDKENTIAFKIQNGPIKEVGVNGCQVDTLIHVAIKMLSGLDAKFPCKQNKMAINKLEMAIAFLADRKRDREERGVEGLSKP